MKKLRLEIPEHAYWQIINDASKTDGTFYEMRTSLKPILDAETGKISLKLSWWDLHIDLELVDDLDHG